MVRLKNRWLLVEFIPPSPAQQAFESKQIWNAIKQSILVNFGDVGWGSVSLNLTVKYYSPMTNVCIIRVARDQHNIAWAGLTMVTAIEGVRVIPNVVHLSGTIKQAQLAAISHNREVVARFRAQAKNPGTYRDSYDQFLETSTREIEGLQD